ncbi:tyrosine-type recombinase/integrase [Gluconobacter kondonii]|uniref:tyrosine-type recombinase/integrase n=1 Tax=Gluconobacter kondonii TaxID=941463 RepID=UPI001B8D0A1D|nr:tyrosine-type recombinase/integrase [Gluconobacter kondonii]MBS1054919.1 tyrosine-type recombinase/integrase [Gluconobacter kondonii]
MLRIVGSQYYFRRSVPLDLRAWLGRGEVSHPLKTSNKLLARQKAALLYARTGQCFEEIRRMTTEPAQKALTAADIIAFYEQFVKDWENYHNVRLKEEETKHRVELAQQALQTKAYMQQVDNFLGVIAGYFEQTDAFLAALKQTQALNTAVTKTRETMLRDEIAGLRKLVVDIKALGSAITSAPALSVEEEQQNQPPQVALPPAKENRKNAKSRTISAMAQRFVLNDANKSADTIKGTKTTLDLFIEAFGDLPVNQVTGTTAGDFHDLLLGLPATHGKSKNRLPIRDAVKSAKEQGLETVSGKTVKNHFSRMSSLWSVLVQREIVAKNPWSQWSFNTTKKTERRCWTDEELELLTTAQWEHRGISCRTYAGMVNVALYTGLRLGEICNLRCQDIENVQGVACFHVRPHQEDGWSPKSAAGTRLVPIHSQLIKAGIMGFLKPNQHFLFPDLPASSEGVRGAAFGQAFSKLKTKLDLPAEITFHSFRHTVSTKLRNQNASLRELWIDRVLGHEASHRSQGTMNYTSSIDVQNLKSVIEALGFPTFKLDIPEN